MKISKNTKAIALLTFSCYCDLCSKTAPSPQLLTGPELTIRPSAERDLYSFNNGEPWASVPPVTETMYQEELMQAGWKFETLHGKGLVICPACAAK